MVMRTAARILANAGHNQLVHTLRRKEKEVGECTRNRHPRNLPQRARQAAYKRDNQPNNPKHNTASAMLGEGIHHDRECQNMAPHNKDQEEQLRSTHDFTPEAAQHDFARVRHAVDVWVCELELADDIAGVCGDDAESDDEDDAAIPRERQGLVKSKACISHGGLGDGLSNGCGVAGLEGLDLRDETEGGHGRGEGEDSQRDRFCDHDCSMST